MILASDLDGTLLQNSNDNIINERDIKSIKQFRAAGNKFGLVTGRPPKLTANIFKKNPELEYDFNVFCTGAFINMPNENILYEKIIPFKTVQKIVRRANELKADHLMLCDKSSSYAARLGKSWADEIDTFWGREFLDFSPDSIYLRKQVLTILIGFDDILLCEKRYKELKTEFDGHASFFLNMGGIDVCAEGITKSTGLSIIERHFHEKIYTIGNGQNDIDMLYNYHGFAIENGCAQAKYAANHVVSNVADAINMLLLVC